MLGAWLVCFALLSATAAGARPFPTPPAAQAWAPALAEADSLLRAQRVDAGLEHCARLRADAAAHGQRWVVMATHVIDAAGNGMMGRPQAADASARSALALARALRDAAYQRRAQRWLAFALGLEGRSAAADSLWRVLLRESTAARDTAHVGYAHLGIAFDALTRGDLAHAVPHYRSAVRWLALAHDAFLIATARIGLARALAQSGDVDGARDIYTDILHEAERANRGRATADALNNLGALAVQSGDAEAATGYWQRSIAAFRAAGDAPSGMIPVGNLSIVLLQGGRRDEALAVVDSALADARRLSRRDLEAMLWVKRAEALAAMARYDESWSAAERAIGLLPTGPEKTRVDARLVEYDVLNARGAARERAAFVEREFPPLFGSTTGQPLFQLRLRLATALFDAGRFREANAAAVQAESLATAIHLPAYAPAAWLLSGRALRAMGERRGAIAALRTAHAGWDSIRVAIRDPEWREREGQRGGVISVELADLLLDGHERDERSLRAAWTLLQSCKGRTLAERMQGPLAFAAGGARAVRVASLARVRSALRADEVLLDAFVGQRVTLVFAVTPRTLRVARLPGADSLAERLHLYQGVLARGAAADAPALRARATTAISDLLLAPLVADIARARRVVISPDGALQGLSFAELTLPGAATGVALGERHELCRVPSATVFADLRRRALVLDAPRTLAWCGGAAAGRAGLPGAADEVAWIASHVAGVTARDGTQVRELPTERALAAYDVLHFASHARVLAQQPWRSALLLADSAGCAGEPWLTADRVARMRLRAQLAVLAGCETGMGEVLPGEGVLGLSNAFLAAGSASVVASLWPVDDHATGLFMRAFYSALMRGGTVSGAVGAAQRALAAEPATAAPFYWAGFVVSGDGAVRVPLRTRAGGRP